MEIISNHFAYPANNPVLALSNIQYNIRVFVLYVNYYDIACWPVRPLTFVNFLASQAVDLCQLFPQSGRWPLSTYLASEAVQFQLQVQLQLYYIMCTIPIIWYLCICVMPLRLGLWRTWLLPCLWLFALKAGPMKDLAYAKSVAVCPQGWAYEGLGFCHVCGCLSIFARLK